MIRLEHINKTYKSKNSTDTMALKDINLSFSDKGLVFIVGKSGSGKTTLLNLLGTLDSPDSGKIIVDGYDICKFNISECESYRNTYVGFVFQEFNLLDEFNVYDNINLSLKLNEIDDDSRVKKVLEDVDLKGFEKRNINELSGGQKQRVSLARAIIKEPKLILADEPTGNLDRKSSKQILDLLKSISKDHLVVVVSHDLESAKEYADRIISIEDGEVIKDSKNVKVEEKESIKLRSTKLPLSYIFKMAYSYTMANPVRLVMTILLTMIALSFMCFTINTYMFDNTTLLIKTMKDNNNYNLKIEHINVIVDVDSRTEQKLTFENDGIDYIEKLSNSKVNPVYYLYGKGERIGFIFGTLSDELKDNSAYSNIPSAFKYVVLNDNRIIPNIIGSYPSNKDEVVVHKYFADIMVNAGIIDENLDLYKPSSFEEIINSKKRIKLGNSSVVISGIVDDNATYFQRAFKSGTFWDEDLRKFYNTTYSSYGSVIYVNEDFVNSIELSNELNLSKIYLKYNSVSNNEKIIMLNEKIDYIDMNGDIKSISSLEENDVIISYEELKNYNSKYQVSLDSYIKEHSNMVYNDIVKTHLQLYLKNNEFDNRIELINTSNESEEKKVVNIIGISFNNNYISDKYSSSIANSQKYIDYLIVYVDDEKDLKNMFNNLDVLYTYNYFKDGDKYRVSYDMSSSVSSIIYAYGRIKRFLLTVSMIFVLFSLLLIFNFISASIDSYKKQIGILRSIGSKNIDIIKIFTTETLIIGVISWLFGTIIWIAECMVMNNAIYNTEYFELNAIIINPMTSVIVLIFDVVISLMLSISVINKINKIKPIDVILNKY